MVDFQSHTNFCLDVLRVREEEVDQRSGLLVTDQSMPVIVNLKRSHSVKTSHLWLRYDRLTVKSFKQPAMLFSAMDVKPEADVP